MKREDAIKSLKEYYQKEQIGVFNFNCKHMGKEKDQCSPVAKENRGSEAYIGKKYGEPFKLVVVASDRGKDALDIEGRCEEIEKVCIEEKNLKNKPHMQGTLETLKVTFSDTRVTNPEELFRNFAMINAAKCSINEGMKEASPQYFKNCREYIRAEVEILDPDLIILQGRKAAYTFEQLYPNLIGKEGLFNNEGIIECNGKKIRVVSSVHPTAARRTKGMLKKWELFLSKRLPEAIKDLKKA